MESPTASRAMTGCMENSCQERLEAFAKNKTDDPLQYESRDILPKETP